MKKIMSHARLLLISCLVAGLQITSANAASKVDRLANPNDAKLDNVVAACSMANPILAFKADEAGHQNESTKDTCTKFTAVCTGKVGKKFSECYKDAEAKCQISRDKDNLNKISKPECEKFCNSVLARKDNHVCTTCVMYGATGNKICEVTKKEKPTSLSEDSAVSADFLSVK